MGRYLRVRVRVLVLGLDLALVACGGASPGGATADAGAGEAGKPEAPSINGITPARVFLARTTEVTISGSATQWSPATRVDFGPGIEVQSLAVASPTALVAQVVTNKSTPLGTRDVTVEDGTRRERYAGAFAVAAPLTAFFDGTVAQGALGRVTLRVLDTSTPLDVTAVRDIEGNVTYPNLAITLPAGASNLGVATASDFELVFALSVDVDANAGTGDVDLVSGPPSGPTTEFPLPSGIRVTARTATPLVSGVAATGTTAAAYDSALYAFTPAGGMAILDLSATSPIGPLNPALALLPSSGHFADLLGFGNQQTAVVPDGGLLYAVYWENTGGTGPYDVMATATDVAQSAAASAADASPRGAGAVAVTALPFVLTGGDLVRSFDWVKLTVAKATTLRVQTTGDLTTDVKVTGYLSDAMTVVGSQIDTGYAADGTISLAAAGTYYVEFSQGASYAPPHTTYTGIIRVD